MGPIFLVTKLRGIAFSLRLHAFSQAAMCNVNSQMEWPREWMSRGLLRVTPARIFNTDGSCQASPLNARCTYL
jgi:hypothetical protein